jgi:hypothetical protein
VKDDEPKVSISEVSWHKLQAKAQIGLYGEKLKLFMIQSSYKLLTSKTWLTQQSLATARTKEIDEIILFSFFFVIVLNISTIFKRITHA